MVKNITKTQIDQIDKNKDDVITKEEVKYFWKHKDDLPFEVNNELITSTIISKTFPENKEELAKNDFLKELEVGKIDSSKLHTVTVHEGTYHCTL